MEIILTYHVKERIKKRKITEDEVINTIKYAEKQKRKGENIMLKKISEEEK